MKDGKPKLRQKVAQEQLQAVSPWQEVKCVPPQKFLDFHNYCEKGQEINECFSVFF